LPFGAMIGYFWAFVRDRAPSFGLDLLAWRLFRFKQWLWRHGALDRPPALWARPGELPMLSGTQEGRL